MVLIAFAVLLFLLFIFIIIKKKWLSEIFQSVMASSRIFLILVFSFLFFSTGEAILWFSKNTHISAQRSFPIFLLVFLFLIETIFFQMVLKYGKTGLFMIQVRQSLKQFPGHFSRNLSTIPGEAESDNSSKDNSLKQGIVRKFFGLVWEKLLILSGVLSILIPANPNHMPYVTRDSGVFLYFGWRILNGAIPYRDIWDHKPPMIFYINALGLFLANNSRWGVWLLEVTALFFAGYFCFKLISKVFGKFAAVIGLIIWFLTLPSFFYGGNLTTEYTLPLQFASLWAFYKLLHNDKKILWFLIGIMGGVAFFTKQTAIGVWLAIFIFQILLNLKPACWKKLMTEMAIYGAGFMSVLVVWVLLFALNGSLASFWQDAFLYNTSYINSISGFWPKIQLLYANIKYQFPPHLPQFILAGFIIGLILMTIPKLRNDKRNTLIGLLMLDLFFELIFIGLSGRNYQHYFMTMIPAISFFTGLFVWFTLSLFSAFGKSNFKYGLVVILIAGVFWNSFSNIPTNVKAYQPVHHDELVTFIETNSSSDDTVLFWGAESSLNFQTLRKSPTKFIYQYPLYTSGYVTEDMILDFLDEIIIQKPVYIIDTDAYETPIFVFPLITREIQSKISLVKDQYQFFKIIDGWKVYKITN